MFFFQLKLLVYCIVFFHHQIHSILRRFGLIGCSSLTCFWLYVKNYTNAYGKDSNYTNAIDVSITGMYCKLFFGLYCRLYFRMLCGTFFAISILFFFS